MYNWNLDIKLFTNHEKSCCALVSLSDTLVTEVSYICTTSSWDRT
jgi:hypothetical protein